MLGHLARHKEAYERHRAGETYIDIGADFGVSATRARQLAKRWERELERLDSVIPRKALITIALICPGCKGILYAPAEPSPTFRTFTHICGYGMRIRVDGILNSHTPQEAPSGKQADV